jgi:Carboxypeptidase regulatory-like domain
MRREVGPGCVRSGGERRGWLAVLGCVAVLALMAALPGAGRAQDFGLKNVQGKVFDAKEAPINGAIVYLQNSRTNDVKTFITEKDGAYRFAGLSADTDYSLWAAFQGKKSPQKTVSSFDSRKQVYIDLKIK